VTAVGLFSLALLAPAAPPGPALQRGDEFAWTGTITEAVDRPGTRLRRTHDLEVRLFVLEKRETWADAAVMTLVRRTDDEPVSGVLPEVTGLKKVGPAPPAARLDLVRFYADGTVHLIAPLGPSPLRLTPETITRALPAVPLDTFASFEFGIFAPRPAANSWTPVGFDFVHSERCQQLALTQQSPDWDRPVGGQTSWQRKDDAWCSANGLARKVKRSIRHRDGIAKEFAVRIDVVYELKEQGRPIGRMYDRYRADIEAAYLAATEVLPLAKDFARLGPEPFQQRIAKLNAHLEANDPGSPFKEAVFAVRRQLEAVRKGEVIPVPSAPPTAAPPKKATIGRAAPDFQSGKFRLSEQQGKPVMLVFFMPGQETAEPALKVAVKLHDQFAGKATVAAFTVFAPHEASVRLTNNKLRVPVYDGTVAEGPYGIETFPRFFVIDAQGVLTWSFAGVGNETTALLKEQMDRLLAPPVATGSPTGPGNPRPRPAP
jgi:hypothetical protein